MHFKRSHHTAIFNALAKFNAGFLLENQVLFGGGTRICLELNEYRESVDIDFICVNKASYRAVRSAVSNDSLGELVTEEFQYPRGIRADRDAVRCFITQDDINIKLEFVAFADYGLMADSQQLFQVPMLDKDSCYINKLLANADRYRDKPYKDIFDLLAMYQHWGVFSDTTWQKACAVYSEKVVRQGLQAALRQVIDHQHTYKLVAIEQLTMTEDTADTLISLANNMLQEIN